MASTKVLAPSHSRAEFALNVAVILAVVVISMQLFNITYPPLVDLPNHLARHAIQCGGAYGSNYTRYYDFELKAVPNLFADLVYWFDVACSDIFLTNRILIQIMVLNLVASVYALHFVLWRRVSVWPAASALLAYNTSFTYGFENYVLAAPFALYLFALWVVLADKKTLLRLAIVVPLSFGLYFLHIIAFGFFVLLIAGWELGRAIKTRTGWREFILRSSGTFLLFLPAIIHFAILNADSPMGDSVSRFSLFARLDAFASLTVPRFRLLLSLSDIILPMVIIAVLAILVFVGLRKRRLHIFKGMRWVLGITFLAALLAPFTLANVAFVHIRYPYLVAAVFIAATCWKLSLRKQAALALVILALFAGRTYEIRQEWLMHDAEIRELLDAAQALPEGAWVLPARSELSDVLIRHSHSLSYIGMYYPIFAPNLFNGANPLTPKPEVENFV
ncbi:MAG: hypothetical protein L3J37_11555, partial [Rhodobacteraceae bacterium]|nr:hypothetical protein [Paracoccaceae bacterium]